MTGVKESKLLYEIVYRIEDLEKRIDIIGEMIYNEIVLKGQKKLVKKKVVRKKGKGKEEEGFTPKIDGE